MRSSSAQTSAILPEMTMRPAQSGRMAESDSRTTRREIFDEHGKTRLLGCTGIDSPKSKIESLLAVCMQVTTGLCSDCALQCIAGKSVVCANEFRRRLIHGASAWTGALQNGWAATFERLMIFMNNSDWENVGRKKAHICPRDRLSVFEKCPALSPVLLPGHAIRARLIYVDNLPRINPTASPSSSNGSPG